MKWAISFPEESILLVRPCLVAICAGNRPAAKLLSVLLYRYSIRQEHKTDAENINEVKAANGETADQDTTFRIYRKQSQLVIDMCNEITEKTLHDVAVPILQLFGYLDVDESPSIHCYDLHVDVVVQALTSYKLSPQQLREFLIDSLQLEKFLINDQLEDFPINKKKFQLDKKFFQLALEKVLIANRNFSNNKRGRKPRSEAAGEAEIDEGQITRDCNEISIEISNESDTLSSESDALASDTLKEKIREKLTDPRLRAVASEMIASEEEDEPTQKMPAIKIGVPHDSVQTVGDVLTEEQLDEAYDAYIAPSKPQVSSAQASVIPKRPRGKKPIVMEPPKPAFELTEEQQRFWNLWRSVWFNADVKPELTDVAYKHVKTLAPFITSMEQMNSLTEYARKELEALQGVRRKNVQLGNCVHSYAGWKQSQRSLPSQQTKPQSRPTLDEVECVDPRWNVYKRPGDDQEWILWQGQLMKPEEADELGYNGGAGLYNATQYA